MAFVAYHSTTRMAARLRRARSSAMATRQLSAGLRLYRVYVSPAGELVGCDFRFGPMLSKKSKSGRARIFCKTPRIRKLPTRSPVALTQRALQCTIENSGTPSAKFGYYDCTASKIHELPPQKPFSTASTRSGLRHLTQFSFAALGPAERSGHTHFQTHPAVRAEPVPLIRDVALERIATLLIGVPHHLYHGR